MENAIGDDSVMSIKVGSKVSRLRVSDPLYHNFIGRTSSELITGE